MRGIKSSKNTISQQASLVTYCSSFNYELPDSLVKQDAQPMLSGINT